MPAPPPVPGGTELPPVAELPPDPEAPPEHALHPPLPGDPPDPVLPPEDPFANPPVPVEPPVSDWVCPPELTDGPPLPPLEQPENVTAIMAIHAKVLIMGRAFPGPILTAAQDPTQWEVARFCDGGSTNVNRPSFAVAIASGSTGTQAPPGRPASVAGRHGGKTQVPSPRSGGLLAHSHRFPEGSPNQRLLESVQYAGL